MAFVSLSYIYIYGGDLKCVLKKKVIIYSRSFLIIRMNKKNVFKIKKI